METFELKQAIDENKTYKSVKKINKELKKVYEIFMVIVFVLLIGYVIYDISLNRHNEIFLSISWNKVLIPAIIMIILRYLICSLVKVYFNFKRDSLLTYSNTGYNDMFDSFVDESFKTSVSFNFSIMYFIISFIDAFLNPNLSEDVFTIILYLIISLAFVITLLYQLSYVYLYKRKIDIAIKRFVEYGEI